MLTLRSEPELCPPLAAAVATARHRGAAALPVPEGLRWTQAARWAWRWALERDRALGPLVLVGLDALDGSAAARALRGAASTADGGWLALGPGWGRHFTAEKAEAAAREAGAALLLTEDGATPRPTELARILRLDRLHLAATDPGLRLQRASLLTHAAAAGVVHLRGPLGAGRRALFEWCHAALGGRARLRHVRSGRCADEADDDPGAWLLFDDPATLSVEALSPLVDRLQREARPAWAPQPPHRAPPPRPPHPAWRDLLGDSAAIREAMEDADRFARDHRLDVLLLGERGVGKECFARAIHHASGRSGAFVAVDLASRAPELIEADLFGAVRGAYTGAHQDRAGAFRRADGGTLFLDELGNLPARAQAALLRALQEREVTPLGGDRPVRVDVRVISATNADLRAMVRRGAFRADLLDRLDMARVQLPPLRVRPEDIPALALDALPEPTPERLPPETLARLQSWSWPGNVRELLARVREAAARAGGGPVRPEHLRGLGEAEEAPIAIVSEADPGERRWPMDPEWVAWASSTTIQIPSLRDRGLPSIRAALRWALDDRPITGDALEVLASRAWWGGLPELLRAAAAIRAAIPGLVDLAALEDRLPELAQLDGVAPIRMLVQPAIQADGEPVGPRVDLDAGAVLLGRAPALADALADDGRQAGRVAAIERLCGGRPPALFSVQGPAALGRAHLLLTRGDAGLQAHLLPGAQLQTFAGPLGQPALPLEVGRPRELGEAGELRVVADDGAQALLVFVFLGELAWDAARERLRATVPARVAETEDLSAGDRRAKWPLDEAEADALAGLIVEAAATDLPLVQVAREQLRALRARPELRRLCDYIDSAHPTQSIQRLLTSGQSPAPEIALRRRLAGADPALYDRLPRWAQSAVGRVGAGLKLVPPGKGTP